METVLKRYQNLDWYMLGSWNPTAGQETTHETVSGRDYTKGQILLFTPYANNRFNPSVFVPVYAITGGQKVRVSWMVDADIYCYVDVVRVDGTHFKVTGSSNMPNDCQIQCFVLAYYGAY